MEASRGAYELIRKPEFPERIAPIYIEAAPSHQSSADPLPGHTPGLWMTSVECANPYCKGDVIGPLTLL